MDRTPPEVVDAVEDALRERMSGFMIPDYARVGGADFMAKVLSQADRTTERSILAALEERDIDLATQVRQLLFTFDQIRLLDDRSLQRVLREVDSKDLSSALKGASGELQEQVLKNLSSRAADTLREDMALTGQVRPRQVLESQQRIVAIVRRLEEQEEIVIDRRGADGNG
jgi:flagellar motor switch protein FliG